MANLLTVDVTAGVPTAGTGTVMTLNSINADGGLVTLGAKADAKSTATDTTAVTLMQVTKQVSASVQALQAAIVTLETGRVPVNSVSGQAGIAGGAGATSAATTRTVAATDDVMFGALTETAPTTDTASSGLNGRLQRIAQRISSLISPGLSATVSVTRPSDTTTYGAGDVVGVTGGGTACIDFNLGAISGSNIMITSARLQRDVAALISGETSYSLYLFSVTQPGAQVDNAAFTVAAGDQASYLGKISLGTPVDEGATLSIDTDAINKQVKLAGTHIFGVLVTVGGYTPASATVHRITLNAVQL